MPNQSDLSPLFSPAAIGMAQPMHYVQGTVIAWNQATAENTVDVGGSEFANLPVLNTSEAVSLTAGAIVAVVSMGDSWAVLGRLTIPGTPDAASALDALNGLVPLSAQIKTDTISTSESTSSATYTDLATVGPTCTDVLISSSGRALVILSASIVCPNKGGSMGYEVSGATSVDADLTRSLALSEAEGLGTGVAVAAFISRVVEASSLTPGLNTFTAKYYRTSGSTAVSFQDRNLTVIPL